MAPVLVFPDFDKPFLLKTDASKEGLGVVLSQKQDDRCYHQVAFGSHSLTPSEKNYHSLKLKFLMLKWSITEHFKEYLVYALFVICTDNNPLTYILTTPNLDATGHRWVGALASFEFTLEYLKGANNRATDTLSCVGREEAEAGEEILCEHVRLENEACVKAVKLAPMHIVDWGEAQEVDAVLVAYFRWL